MNRWGANTIRKNIFNDKVLQFLPKWPEEESIYQRGDLVYYIVYSLIYRKISIIKQVNFHQIYHKKRNAGQEYNL